MINCKFRGKRKDTQEWIYGGLDIQHGKATIFDHNCICHSAYEVDIDTVGQLANEEENLYDGDIVYGEEKDEYGSLISSWYGLLYYDEDKCAFIFEDDLENFYGFYDFDFLRKVGNKHDNPELVNNPRLKS